MKRKRLESQIAASLDQYMQLRAKPGVVWFHIPNGGLRNPRTGARLKREGTKAGVPDFYFCREGEDFFLELKSENGRLSDAQIAMQERLRNAGKTVANAYGMDEVIGYVKEWGLVR